MQSNPFLGVFLHSIGAFSSSSCYTPQKQTRLWSWEVYWVTTAFFAWFLLPIAGAFLTIPNYLQVLANCPSDVMLRSLGLGIVYGVGGLTFGLGIRYIGFSLTYAIAIGISAVFGTVVPAILGGTLVSQFQKPGGLIVLAGFIVSIVGVAVCGRAGFMKEKELEDVFYDCETGAVPPLGPDYRVPTVLDRRLTLESDIYFEAGDHVDLVHVSATSFLKLMRGAETLDCSIAAPQGE